MRDYTVYARFNLNDFRKNHACFSFLRRTGFFNSLKKGDEIYIDSFTYRETKKYIPLIVKVINEITPCSLVKDDLGIQLIKFQLTNHYNKDVLLLNFIRNLWYEVGKDYNKLFFEFLKEENSTDPMVRLTSANKQALTVCGYNMRPNHNNCVPASQAKVRNTEEFKIFEGRQDYVYSGPQAIEGFLIGE